jgi:hypothetical protein
MLDAGGVDSTESPDGFPMFGDIPPLDVRMRDVAPNPDAFFADNPPPRYCLPDGASADLPPPPDVPGGTPECPDDLLREGCPCTRVGEERPCWPGLRVNRNRGICRDGTTRCEMYDELGGRWGACRGYVLPDPMATRGPAACTCFSRGRWELANTSPCFITSGSMVYAVSTYLDAMGRTQCPTLSAGARPPFGPMPGVPFSTNRLTVDCAGQFELCYTIRAGNVMRPSPSDCVVGRACTMGWYAVPDVAQTLPALPGWTGADPTCAARFQSGGGYGEMTVRGTSVECQAIDDGMGMPFVFLRIPYCSARCAMMPSLPECRDCGTGGSGDF